MTALAWVAVAFVAVGLNVSIALWAYAVFVPMAQDAAKYRALTASLQRERPPEPIWQIPPDSAKEGGRIDGVLRTFMRTCVIDGVHFVSMEDALAVLEKLDEIDADNSMAIKHFRRLYGTSLVTLGKNE